MLVVAIVAAHFTPPPLTPVPNDIGIIILNTDWLIPAGALLLSLWVVLQAVVSGAVVRRPTAANPWRRAHRDAEIVPGLRLVFLLMALGVAVFALWLVVSHPVWRAGDAGRLAESAMLPSLGRLLGISSLMFTAVSNVAFLMWRGRRQAGARPGGGGAWVGDEAA